MALCACHPDSGLSLLAAFAFSRCIDIHFSAWDIEGKFQRTRPFAPLHLKTLDTLLQTWRQNHRRPRERPFPAPTAHSYLCPNIPFSATTPSPSSHTVHTANILTAQDTRGPGAGTGGGGLPTTQVGGCTSEGRRSPWGIFGTHSVRSSSARGPCLDTGPSCKRTPPMTATG